MFYGRFRSNFDRSKKVRVGKWSSGWFYTAWRLGIMGNGRRLFTLFVCICQPRVEIEPHVGQTKPGSLKSRGKVIALWSRSSSPYERDTGRA